MKSLSLLPESGSSTSRVRWPRKAAGAAAIGLVLAAPLTGCSRHAATDAAGKQGARGLPVPVLVAQATEETVPVQIQEIGNVTPYSRVTVRSQITGQLREVHFNEGQAVRKGDLLFTIDPRPTQAALEQARANLARDQAQLENARIQFGREKKLFDSQLVSREEFDNASAVFDAQQGTVLADQAVITNAELNLGYTTIRSPIDGRTGSLMVYPGNIVKSPDDAMVIINQVHPIYVAFSVPEQHLPEIRRELSRQPLKVEAAYRGMNGPAPQGDVTFIDNTVDPTTGQIQLKATFPNEDNRLWPGQFVTVTLTLAELPRVIVVPSQAIQTGQTNQFVFVVNSDQTVEMRPVTLGENYRGDTVVLDGVRAKETVVTDGQLRLVPGAKVNAKTDPLTAAGPAHSTTDPP